MHKFALPFCLLLSIITYCLGDYYVISHGSHIIFNIARLLSDIFIDLLKLISLPLIFLSIISVLSGLKDSIEVKFLLRKILFYTLFTTITAASIALVFYLLIDPAKSNIVTNNLVENNSSKQSYLPYLKSLIPSNVIKIFLENNVIGAMFIAFLIGVSVLSLQKEKQMILHQVFSALFDTLLKVTQYILKFIPVAICAFIICFLHDLKDNHQLYGLLWYLFCVIFANFVQAFLVLPLLMWYKGISSFQTFKGVLSALTIGFFSKSSSGTLPTTINCVQKNLNVSKKISSIVLPVCTTINMNACASFILITVMFVSESNGYVFTFCEMFAWIFLSTLAAVGNAGIPMGCYFMATNYLIAMNIPLHIMGVILPFYAIIDMLETAINIWSDVCITQIVNKEYTE
ncbi:dicarboxylate/amino acid:cation symporter [Wolbachia endosymbiont of Pentidionis agamae]|uniref:dicarboxylate/amino acid:cation symporter n=1 Tax=Wolbachia endosymbiont of Pentidionis agamae TaxID=3110435 RepID=UPI002FCFB2FC